MTRAFTLIELLVGITIGAIVLAGVLTLSANFRGDALRLTSRLNIYAAINSTQLELNQLTRTREPIFWDAFPPKIEQIHPVDHQHGPFQFSRTCPLAIKGSCFIFWDINPPNDDHGFYTVAEVPEEPLAIRVSPVEARFPPGSHPSIGSSSVLLAINGQGVFPQLISEALPDRLRLAEASVHPWPTLQAPSLIRKVVHLGDLRVTHVHLNGNESTSLNVVLQHWRYTSSGWKAAPRLNAPGRLTDSVWQPCSEHVPDRFTLIAKPLHPKVLAEPLRIADRIFRSEVIRADITL